MKKIHKLPFFLLSKPTPSIGVKRVDIVKGMLTPIPLIGLFVVSIFKLFFSTWATLGFQEEFNLLTNLWSMAITGAVLHFLISIPHKFHNFELIPSEKSFRNTLILVSVTFFSISLLQFAILGLIGTVAPQITQLQILPSVAINSGAAIAEEWVFAWGIFTFLFWFVTLRHHEPTMMDLFIVLLVNGIIFSLFHSAVGLVLYGGETAFLPAIFASRVALDMSFYISGGRLEVPMSGHFLINFFKSLVIVTGGIG